MDIIQNLEHGLERAALNYVKDLMPDSYSKLAGMYFEGEVKAVKLIVQNIKSGIKNSEDLKEFEQEIAQITAMLISKYFSEADEETYERLVDFVHEAYIEGLEFVFNRAKERG